MRIEKLHLKNFCSFQDLEIFFPQSNVAVFIGNNGAGKTSILKAIVLLLSWLVNRIEREKGNGSPINELDILNGANFTQIEILINDKNKIYKWSLAKTTKGNKKKFDSSLIEATKLAESYKLTETNNISLPLMIYYSVERAVLDVPLKLKTSHNFGQLDGYDNALSQGVDFRRFFEWFRNREDIENEYNAEKQIDLLEVINELTQESANEAKLVEKLKTIKNKKIFDKQLNTVRQAIYAFMSDFSNLRVQRKPRLRMLVDKKGNNKPLDIVQLSQGEKSLLALIGDIARRLAIMNPELENPLIGEGIVLIDEVDMHLHPKWQRDVLPALQKTFPNIQFIVTTHSPQVLSRVDKDDIFILKDNKIYQPSSNPIGRNSTDILEELMEVSKRPTDIEELSNKYFGFINQNLLDEAQKLREELSKILDKDDPLFARADAILMRKKLLGR